MFQSLYSLCISRGYRGCGELEMQSVPLSIYVKRSYEDKAVLSTVQSVFFIFSWFWLFVNSALLLPSFSPAELPEGSGRVWATSMGIAARGTTGPSVPSLHVRHWGPWSICGSQRGGCGLTKGLTSHRGRDPQRPPVTLLPILPTERLGGKLREECCWLVWGGALTKIDPQYCRLETSGVVWGKY